MPIKKIDEYMVIFPDFDFNEKYWKILTTYFTNNYGTDEIKEPHLVQEILKECFQILILEFEKLLNSENRASFVLFAHNFHEDSIDLWRLQTEGHELPTNEEYFAASRRGLKIVLEQSSKLDLVGTPDFYNEIVDNVDAYTIHLEELLYLTYQSYLISEMIARSQLFPKSVGVNIDEERLVLLTYFPYNQVYHFIFNDIPKHSDSVAIDENAYFELNNVLRDTLGINYEIGGSMFSAILNNPDNRYAVTYINFGEIAKESSLEKEKLTDFIDGLTVSSENVLSVEDCIIRNQSIERFMYRPFLKVNIDGKDAYIIGGNKWQESIVTSTTNAIQFGFLPQEWNKYKPIRQIKGKLSNDHAEILEKPVVDILNKQNIKNDNNINSFEQIGKKDNVNVNEKAAVGEFDLIFLDEVNQIIYVAECKNNRSRFDLNNWRRDYEKFIKTYENQLDNKVNWTTDNKQVIQEHFSIKYNEALDISEYSIKGIFVINAPTIYMYNGKYKALTIHDIQNLVLDNYNEIELPIRNEETGKTYNVTHPYFDNLDKILT
jgi:hypothetical protein